MFKLTMKKATLSTLIFFIFANQRIFGKLTILRGLSLTKNQTEKSICLSEDDGGALVWNPNLLRLNYVEGNNFQFRDLSEFNNDGINCKMNANEGCLKSWTRDNWGLTNSLRTPMGPVFDQRWEEFKQYENIEGDFQRVDFNLTADLKLPFSVRALHDLHLLFCDGMNFNTDYCYWIIIRCWINTYSVIIKCETGAPLSKGWPAKNSKCREVVHSYQHKPLSEWQTFVITWNSVTREINVYDIDGIFLTYTEKLLYTNTNFHTLFIRSVRTFMRFHIYDFLHTTVESAILTSPDFQLNADTICIQLLIGLCAECDAHVVLFDVSNNKVLEEITVKGSSKVASHGLPMWQSVKIKSNSINFSNSWMKIQLTTKLNDKWDLNPLWAIANVRQCPQKGALRKGAVSYPQFNRLSFIQLSDRLDYFGNLTCQKLFYDEHAVVSSQSSVKLDVNLDDIYCSDGKIGPQCLISCESLYDNNCKGVKICYTDGCTCASGFSGDNCSEPCGSSTYGYNCKKTCGSCLYRTSKERCNEVTGECSNGCDNSKEVVYIPPLCQTNVDKPDEPRIISINEATIYAVVPITWKDEFNGMSIFYSFAIKEENTYNEKQPLWSILFRNITQLIGYFENLEPATNYQIRCSLLIADMHNVQIHGDWKVAVTKSLDESWNYTFTINNNSVVDLHWLYPWKANYRLGFFRIRIEELFSHLRESVSRSSINKVLEHPVTQYMSNYSQRLYLFPSTVYNISIEAVTVANKSSNPKFVKIHMPSTATFDNLLDMVVESNSTILLNIPHVLNDTRDSMMHITVKGANPCEQYSDVPESLRVLAGLTMNETAWQAAKVSTSEFSGKQFRVGDNGVYGNAKNCPLKSEELYKIVIIVMGNNSSTKPIILTSSIRIDVPMNYKPWIISIILFLVLTGAAFYLCQSKKRQKRIAQLKQAEMALPQDMDIYEVKMNPIISNLAEDLSNHSNAHFISQTISPRTSNAITHDDEEEEMQSLVEVNDFEDYVRQAIQSGLLDKQYKTFPKGQIRTCDYGKLPQNKYKNRYENLIAYDETRVILKALPGDVHSDYINANYITGTGTEKNYIATQGPKPNTIIDFWRMIWQESVLIICMLANVVENGKTICEQYWPDIGKKKKYGDVIVLNASHKVFADYCFRTFHVTCGEETRKIEHLHYTAWPDHGVPLYTNSIVTYLKKLLATSSGDGPVVVHCSAGTGRTGTIILCDVCLRQAATDESINVFTEMTSIAIKRPNLMDNKQQYLLAHLVLLECFFSILTTLPCNHMLVTQIRKQMSSQHQRLQNVAWQDEVLRHGTSPLPLSECNRAKNRFPELISDNVNRIYLKRYPTSDEDGDYISGVYVDGVKLRNQYVATQLPMPSTNNDFWRMVAEFKVGLILMLQSPDLQDPTCCAIAPASGKFNPIPYLNITLKEVVEMEYYTSQKLLLVDNSEKPSRKQFVTILCLTEWKPGKDQPLPPVMMMITFWQAAEKIARGDGPIVTLCHDGVTGCGLYLAMSFLLERMAIEKECDVYSAVRAIRRSRPDFVCSLEHLEYLCEAAVTYLECFKA